MAHTGNILSMWPARAWRGGRRAEIAILGLWVKHDGWLPIYPDRMVKLKGINMNSLQDWHVPFHQDTQTLREVLATIPGAYEQAGLPLMLRLQRDPDLSFLGQQVFKAGLDRNQNDCIHILLGRGMHGLDQAFVLGFTIGCSKKGSVPEHKLNGELGRHFFRQRPVFDEAEAAVFKEAIKLAYMSFCAPLENFNFATWLDNSLSELRLAAGLESELLLAYYAIEKYRYPFMPASQRLLPEPAQVAGI